jgi:hypothetical protein
VAVDESVGADAHDLTRLLHGDADLQFGEERANKGHTIAEKPGVSRPGDVSPPAFRRQSTTHSHIVRTVWDESTR